MKRRKIFEIKYCINYSSGKKWIDIDKVYALSEYGAIETIKWRWSNYDISIISINILGYVGNPIYEDIKTLGDF